MTNNYFIIKETQFEKVKKLIIENKKLGMTIIFSNIDDEFSRKVLEKLGKDIDIYLINVSNRKDKQKQRESGFNHVLAKICQKQNITLGINLDEIIDSENLKEKSDILGRIRQNIVLANKNNMKMN